MKILISGHTSGIGLAISQYFSNIGHDITGFSRTNSRDLNDDNIQNQFAQESLEHDVIIINANVGFNNVHLLYKVYNIIKNQDKTIVVLGSRRTEILTSFPMEYQIEKIAIEETARQLQNSSKLPNIVILRPGYVNTSANNHVTTTQTSPQSVAELLDWILETNKTKDFKILNLLFAPQ